MLSPQTFMPLAGNFKKEDYKKHTLESPVAPPVAPTKIAPTHNIDVNPICIKTCKGDKSLRSRKLLLTENRASF